MYGLIILYIIAYTWHSRVVQKRVIFEHPRAIAWPPYTFKMTQIHLNFMFATKERIYEAIMLANILHAESLSNNPGRHGPNVYFIRVKLQQFFPF